MGQYAAKHVKIALLGREVTATDISYEVETKVEPYHALGNQNPIGETTADSTYKGEIAILQSELEAMQRTLPAGKNITDIAAFDIVVLYKEEGNPIFVTDILRGCRFKSLKKGMKKGDNMMEVKIPLYINSIDYNVAS